MKSSFMILFKIVYFSNWLPSKQELDQVLILVFESNIN